MADDRTLWTRPAECTCKAALRGADAGNGTNGPLRLIRLPDVRCPLHGDRKDVLEDAVEAAERILESVPGLPRIARPQLRRLIVAAAPILAKAIAEGRLPNIPEPPAPPAPPVDPVEPGA